MEIERLVPLWLTWLAAGGIGLLAIAAVARIFDALFELDAS
jgi:hypothetical protein